VLPASTAETAAAEPTRLALDCYSCAAVRAICRDDRIDMFMVFATWVRPPGELTCCGSRAVPSPC